MTVQQVFDMAIHLMDEQSEADGSTSTEDTQEYKFRTISILNTAIPRLYPYSDSYEDAGDGRPVPVLLESKDYKNPNFSQDIDLDDSIVAGVLPFWLASQLLAEENETLSAVFLNQYYIGLEGIKKTLPSSFQSIAMPYGTF